MRKKRKCSQCGKKGHDKRRCPDSVDPEVTVLTTMVDLVNSYLDSLGLNMTLGQRNGQVYVEQLQDLVDSEAMAVVRYAVLSRSSLKEGGK
mgnify:CR=1 FL=1